MILKITINDNDYGPNMGKFCEYLAQGAQMPGPEPPESDERAHNEWNVEYVKRELWYRSMLKKTFDELTYADGERIKSIVTDTFHHWVCNHMPEPTRAYLLGAFRCSIVRSVTDEWQNGEAFFVFPTSYAGKVLCF